MLYGACRSHFTYSDLSNIIILYWSAAYDSLTFCSSLYISLLIMNTGKSIGTLGKERSVAAGISQFTGWTKGESWFDFRKGQGVSLLQSLLLRRFQAGSGAHPKSCSIDTRTIPSPRIKRPGSESKSSPPYIAEVKCLELCLHSPLRIF